MTRLLRTAADTIASVVTDEVMERVEQHIDAHPLRYGGELPDDAYDAIREKVEFEQRRLMRELEVPPR